MYGYIFLCLAIIAEVVATTSLKAVSGLTKPIPVALVILGYGTAIWLLSIVVQTIPVGVAYATWAGLGIVLVAIASYFVYGQKLDVFAVGGMAFILVGVIMMQALSDTVGR
ncbi:DMT family transporter [Candidatus Pantoea soli]|uniref:QacE family quaternary ammonium compound efflux SMR transporter n=1 Tax=Candidatus Pantoea soli TaxID=3098669 RepID=A0A518XJL1_9GAMM|nr:multidrug efflux SMR transporter [Pantoea soli]QDY44381.1 QacE family quaternary ammonium compound efflux SMR transporter [Pantoea soli]